MKKKLQNDATLQQTVAQYYKLPRFLKQQRSKTISTISELELQLNYFFLKLYFAGEVNKTAQNIKVKHLRPSPPPNMQDFLNPNAGKYINTTENEFEQQLYTGKVVNLLVLYRKLQDIDCWYP